MFLAARAVLLSMRAREDLGPSSRPLTYISCDTRESGGVIVRDTRHANFLSRHYDRLVNGLPGASLPREPNALHISLTFDLLVFCSSDAVAV